MFGNLTGSLMMTGTGWKEKLMYVNGKKWISVFFLLIFLVPAESVFSAEHTVERGETALQIAIDHDLTMDQLSRLNPGVDLEMMHVGDILTVPDEGGSFSEFLDRLYSGMLQISGLHCEIAADHHAICLFQAGNITEVPLYDVNLEVTVRDRNGRSGSAEESIPLIQIMPGEKLPVCIEVQSIFDAAADASAKVTGLSRSDDFSSSFRIPDEMFVLSGADLPGGIGRTLTIRFHPAAAAVYAEKKINVLAAAYAADGSLAGVRSLYTDFYPEIGITVYSVGPAIDSAELIMEAY